MMTSLYRHENKYLFLFRVNLRNLRDNSSLSNICFLADFADERRFFRRMMKNGHTTTSLSIAFNKLNVM